MNEPRLDVVFSGGGTAGHLFPGLAVAGQLERLMPDVRITFAGSGREFERSHVAAAGYDYLHVPCAPLPQHLADAWTFLGENWRGVRLARKFLRRRRPLAVIGLGGFASAPLARAAVAAHVPLVLLEQNAVPGRVTRWLAPRASLVCLAFKEAAHQVHSVCPVRVTGNPVRAGFAWPRIVAEEFGDPLLDIAPRPRLMVLGGSGGAMTLNEQVPLALYKLKDALEPWQIVHQTGAAGFELTCQRYRKLDIPAHVVPFVKELPCWLSTTDLVVSRAGGTTLAELAAASVPSILVPYPYAADDHQLRNAQVFSRAGAARMVDQRTGPGRLDERLTDAIREPLADAALRRAMAEAALKLARPHAAWHVATMIGDLVRPAAQRMAA